MNTKINLLGTMKEEFEAKANPQPKSIFYYMEEAEKKSVGLTPILHLAEANVKEELNENMSIWDHMEQAEKNNKTQKRKSTNVSPQQKPSQLSETLFTSPWFINAINK